MEDILFSSAISDIPNRAEEEIGHGHFQKNVGGTIEAA